MKKSLEVLVFTVDGQKYALPISDVTELVRAASFAPLPKAPAIVEGVLNFRGKIIPVLNLRARFGHSVKPLTYTEHLVIANAGDKEVAIRADQATEIINVEIDPSLPILKNIEYVAGIAKLDGELLLIHDLRTFLTQEEVVAISQAISAVGESS